MIAYFCEEHLNIGTRRDTTKAAPAVFGTEASPMSGAAIEAGPPSARVYQPMPVMKPMQTLRGIRNGRC